MILEAKCPWYFKKRPVLHFRLMAKHADLRVYVCMCVCVSLLLPSRARLLGSKMQMKPLNDCLKHYIDKRNSDKKAPRWILFHDADEYIFPVNTDLSLPEALDVHNSRCCAVVRWSW